jgi:arylformamidase
MCEACDNRIKAWRGWVEVPPPVCGPALGPWIDLSHTITEDLARSPKHPQPHIRRIVSQPQQDANVTEIQMVVHHGTHVDAPRHFFLDGPSIEAIPLDRLYGPAVVWKVEVEPHGLITAAMLKELRPKVRPGEMVILDTGWWRKVKLPEYHDQPSLSVDAAQWLVDHRVKMLAVDFATPDLTAHRRPADYDYPIHRTLLGQGVLIAEHVTNLSVLSGRRVEAMFPAVSIAGADGGQSRAIARAIMD